MTHRPMTAARVGRLLLRTAIVVVLVLLAALAWALFWPAPRPAVACGPKDPPGCREASGRVIYLQRWRPGDSVHAVLVSRSSVSAPLLTVIKLPLVRALPDGLARGHWVSVVGTRVRGSHDEDDIHVVRLRTGKADLRCRWSANDAATHCR